MDAVAANATAWTKISNVEKLGFLKEMREVLMDMKDEYALLSDKLRGVKEGTPAEASGELLSVAGTAGYLNGLIEVYESLVNGGSMPPVSGKRSVDGVEVTQVGPRPSMWGKITDPTIIELWGEPGKAMGQRKPELRGQVCAVMCPGNFESPVDILFKLFVEGDVVIGKLHPLNAACTEFAYPKLFHTLSKRGFVALASGGPEVGGPLLQHPKVQTWMMTGGCATFDAIVWGGAQGKATGKQRLDKECHSELGAASPYIIVPGTWSDSEIREQAQLLLGYKTFNAGHICASPQNVLMDRQWPQAAAFIRALEETAGRLHKVEPYYPGAADRLTSLKNAYPNAKEFPDQKIVLVPDVDVQGAPQNDFVFRNETFAAGLAIKFLDGGNDPAKFLTAAVEFANTKVFGSLSLTVVIDPRTEQRMGKDFERALKKLEWGTIGINLWAAMTANNPYATWGAPTGRHTIQDIQSGQGLMGNVLCVENVHKCVTRGKWCDPVMRTLITAPKKAPLLHAMANLYVFQTVGALLRMLVALIIGR